MYSTRTRVNARLPNGHPCEEKRASVRTKVGPTSRRAERAASTAERPAAARAGHADFRARILARKLARKSVSVSVSVQRNLALNRREPNFVHRCRWHFYIELVAHALQQQRYLLSAPKCGSAVMASYSATATAS